MAEIIPFQADNLPKIIERFKAGKLIAFPTDTVYGLGTTIEDRKAIRRLYRVKQRELTKPSQLLIGEIKQLSKYIIENTPQTELLIRRFWPGPLTIIFKASLEVPHYLCHSGKIAIRFPRYELLQNTITKLGSPIVASSCNLEGENPPSSFENISPKITSKIDAVLVGKTILGLESTIVDPTSSPLCVLREGAITKEQLGI